MRSRAARLTEVNKELGAIDELFDSLDANKDGRVTLAELRSHLQSRGRSEAEITTLFETLDQNKDGVLSRDEVRAGVALYDHIDARWRFLVGRAGVNRIADAGSEDMAEKMQQQRDARLAERDTRKWCLDRCLATGYCDAVEDLWEMTTVQVKQFCENCAGEDECELDFDKADEYMSHLAAAAADGGSGSIG